VPGLLFSFSHQALVVRAPKSSFFTASGSLPILCTAYRKVNLRCRASFKSDPFGAALARAWRLLESLARIFARSVTAKTRAELMLWGDIER